MLLAFGVSEVNGKSAFMGEWIEVLAFPIVSQLAYFLGVGDQFLTLRSSEKIDEEDSLLIERFSGRLKILEQLLAILKNEIGEIEGTDHVHFRSIGLQHVLLEVVHAFLLFL